MKREQRPPKPTYQDYLEAQREQGGMAMALWIAIMVAFFFLALIGMLLRIPHLEVVLGALGLGGAAVVTFIAYDTNAFVRRMREIAEDRENPGAREARERGPQIADTWWDKPKSD